MRVKIFVDFWNLQLAWNEYFTRRGRESVVRIPWHPVLYTTLVAAVDSSAVYAGTHVYASYDPASVKDASLKRFLVNTMDGFPGYTVVVKERKALNPQRCSSDGCRMPIADCPHCGRALRRTVEKGVDTAIVTDMIRYGLDDHYDRALLLAGDADHVPAVEFLGGRMKQVTHVWFRGHANELRNACWNHLFLDDMMETLVASE